MVDAQDGQGGFDLDAALSAYPLPAELEDGTVNRTQLARAMGKSGNTITDWLSKGLPVERNGKNGQEYQFRLSHCWAWRRWQEAAEDRRSQEADALSEQWNLFFRGEDEEHSQPQKSAKEIEAESRAQLAQMQAQERRGLLVRAEPTRQVFEDLLVQFQNALITLPDYAEREFGLTPEQVDTLERWSRETIDETRLAIEANVINRRGDVLQMVQEGAG